MASVDLLIKNTRIVALKREVAAKTRLRSKLVTRDSLRIVTATITTQLGAQDRVTRMEYIHRT